MQEDRVDNLLERMTEKGAIPMQVFLKIPDVLETLDFQEFLWQSKMLLYSVFLLTEFSAKSLIVS